ncbi:unnamed protein product [Rotaria magnacalcarata]|uniref:Innexin n=1 Tax=Rotaria magnacalcarata TaxID=392030 RepID=A0A819BJG6_9BILA|nr:unnamed protein product [Rotaria magnacalcarata]CAF1656496.1 unnamed protein product [Rotaria magnacalcarata]CAF1931853.1 unnamed protein product [Rotaria magnacalcarata]CAF2120591.1 unnamed protein product [Rotaria magnacalcarata]CAF2129271.1 unnamed protein product [Rotaria magnacalcarata]
MADTILKLSRSLIKVDTDKDFLSDQIHYQITFTILIISAIASTSLQYYADPIHCIQPAQFTEGYTTFARTLCWLNNTYFYPQTYTRIPMNKTERLQHTLRYYQWLPFVYLFQAFFFLLPHLIWVSFYKRNGLNPGLMVNQGKKFDDKPEIYHRIAKEIERYLMCRQLAQCKKKLLFRHNVNENHDNSSSPLLLPNISFRIRYHTYYLVTLYLLVKFIYIINIILQVFILNIILSTGNYRFFRFGFDTLTYVFRSSLRERIGELSHQHQQLFPFVTLCDFHIRELGQDHYYTIECILLINIFYEKIYFAMWIWFVILFLISIISLIYSFYIYVPFFARYRFINKFIRCIKGKKQQTFSPYTPISPTSTNITTTDAEPRNNILINVNRQKDFVQWLQRDGVFLLHLLNTHAGERLTIKCVDDLLAIWINNYEEKSKLADRLLKNEFQFSQ